MREYFKPFSLTNLTPKHLEAFFSHIKTLPDEPNKCWLWRGSTTAGGYGSFRNAGYSWVASRLAYFINTGIDPAALLVCHKCDIRLCCNPNHLFLDTHDGNSKDMARKGRAATGTRHATKTFPEMVRHGETSHLAKLTAKQVLEIRKVYRQGGISAAKLGERYRVTGENVYRIVNGINWKHLPVLGNPDTLPRYHPTGSTHPSAKITEDNVREIRKLHTQGMLQREIGAQFGISQTAVYTITSGKRWTHVK